ncbi:carbohydrate binding domain-containing protein [Marinobacter changyiensis]|uniref:carbohydrate binding domain-containing protein n=1 Tax=Marinobacter changyiensis TaxID=2604091 RepID=UPI001265081D|nr:carbohydrate binding domain-containing protein [Marinobacter changyiensis]
MKTALPAGRVQRHPGHGDITTRVVAQTANFLPTVEVGDGGGGGELPVCSKPELENNLIQNGDFTELNGWNSFNQAASLTKFETERSCGRDYLLLVQDRTQFYSGPIQNITPVVEPGAEFRVSAKLMIANGASRDNVRVAFQIRDESGTHYQYLPELSVTQNELSPYSKTFQFDIKGTLSEASVLVYGPQAGVSFLVDELKLEKIAEPQVEPKLVVDQGIENGASGWGGYFSTSLSYSRTAKEGNYGLLSSNRSSWHSGPGFNVHGALTNGGQYSASVDVYLGSSSLSGDNAGLWLYLVDNDGGHWQQLTSRRVATHNWHSLETTFTVEASGPVTQMRMHVFGPQPATNLYTDNLRVFQ